MTFRPGSRLAARACRRRAGGPLDRGRRGRLGIAPGLVALRAASGLAAGWLDAPGAEARGHAGARDRALRADRRTAVHRDGSRAGGSRRRSLGEHGHGRPGFGGGRHAIEFVGASASVTRREIARRLLEGEWFQKIAADHNVESIGFARDAVIATPETLVAGTQKLRRAPRPGGARHRLGRCARQCVTGGRAEPHPGRRLAHRRPPERTRQTPAAGPTAWPRGDSDLSGVDWLDDLAQGPGDRRR